MRICLLFLLVCSMAGYAQRPVIIPAEFMKAYTSKGLDKKYDLNEYLPGLYWDEDFNGDRITDIAITVVEKVSKKKGILLINGKTYDHFVFGAGVKAGKGTDHFNWAGQWSMSYQKEVDEDIIDPKNGKTTGFKTIPLKYPSILVEKMDEGAYRTRGFIYWTGDKYRWIDQDN